MGTSIELNELSNTETGAKIERLIRDSIADVEKDWKAWIYVSSNYCQVVIKGPTQTRERFFFDDVETLPNKIGEWLSLYPLR